MALASDITFEHLNELENIRDIIGPYEEFFTLSSNLLLKFSILDLDLEIDPCFKQLLSTVRLDTVSKLRKDLDNLRNGYGGLVEDLYDALDKVEKKLQEIRDMEEPIDIKKLEECMENSEGNGIVDQLEDNFIDAIEESDYQYEKGIAKVLKMVEPIEKKYDYLEYIMGKVRLYAKDVVKEKLASELRRIVLFLTDGSRVEAINELLDLLNNVREYRQSLIKGREADRIRYKADYILRKVSGTKAENIIEVTSSTALSGLDLQLTFGHEKVNHVAPSKDKETQVTQFDLDYEGEDWASSFAYNYENLDYFDIVNDDKDQLTHELEIELEREFDFFDLSGSASCEKQFFPNEIGDEIEINRAQTCKAAIDDLIQYIKAQGLAQGVEDKLIEDLKEAKTHLENVERDGAVDSLEDFLDEVEDQFWDDNLSETLAEKLSQRAKEILPRERRWFLRLQEKSEFSWENNELKVTLEQEGRTYPADSEENRSIKIRGIEYRREFGNFTVKGFWEWEETKYPRDADSDKKERQREIECELDMGEVDMMVSYNREQTSYPKAPYKNLILYERTIEVEIDPYLIVSLENNHKEYPNNPDKNWMAVQMSLEVEFGSAFVLSWEMIRKNYPNNLVKNLTSTKLGFELENTLSDNIKFEISSELIHKYYPNDPYENEISSSFTASLDMDF